METEIEPRPLTKIRDKFSYFVVPNELRFVDEQDLQAALAHFDRQMDEEYEGRYEDSDAIVLSRRTLRRIMCKSFPAIYGEKKGVQFEIIDSAIEKATKKKVEE
jgi:hypothetical protein